MTWVKLKLSKMLSGFSRHYQQATVTLEAASSLRVSVRTSGIMGIPPRKPKAAQGFMEECKALEAALIGFSSDSN
jgi:hypothetical protein